MKNLLNPKSIEERSDLLSEQASRPYSSTVKIHFLTVCRISLIKCVTFCLFHFLFLCAYVFCFYLFDLLSLLNTLAAG